MAWFKITHRETGETQMVCGTAGIDLEAWTAEPLARAPHAHEVLDGGEGKLRDHRKDRRPMPRTREELDDLIRAVVAEELA